jgi:glutamine synthetase adenylyltransferase
MDDREATNRAAAEHVAWLRARLVAGRSEIDRQRSSISETNDHLSGMARWIEQTDQHLGEERARRAAHDEN